MGVAAIAAMPHRISTFTSALEIASMLDYTAITKELCQSVDREQPMFAVYEDSIFAGFHERHFVAHAAPFTLIIMFLQAQYAKCIR